MGIKCIVNLNIFKNQTSWKNTLWWKQVKCIVSSYKVYASLNRWVLNCDLKVVMVSYCLMWGWGSSRAWVLSSWRLGHPWYWGVMWGWLVVQQRLSRGSGRECIGWVKLDENRGDVVSWFGVGDDPGARILNDLQSVDKTLKDHVCLFSSLRYSKLDTDHLYMAYADIMAMVSPTSFFLLQNYTCIRLTRFSQCTQCTWFLCSIFSSCVFVCCWTWQTVKGDILYHQVWVWLAVTTGFENVCT